MDGEIRVDYGAAEPLVFADVDELLRFLQRQSAVWLALSEGIEGASNGPHRFYFHERLKTRLSEQHAGWATFQSQVEGQQAELNAELLDQFQSELRGRRPVVSDDDRVAMAVEHLEKRPEISAFVLCTFFGDLQWLLDRYGGNSEVRAWYAHCLISLTTTVNMQRQLRVIDDLHAHAETDYARLTSETASALDAFAQRKAQLEESTEASIERAKATWGAINAEWAQLRATYDNSLKLSAPRTYWDGKMQAHARIARSWRKGFFVAALIGLVVLCSSGYAMIHHWANLAAPLQGHAWVVPVLMVGVPGFMLLWLLRLCGRQWTDHMNREEDARERIVMIETFLALSRSEDSPNTLADSAQLALVLGAIFRAGPGFGSDDSPPAGVLEAVIAKLGASSRN